MLDSPSLRSYLLWIMLSSLPLPAKLLLVEDVQPGNFCIATLPAKVAMYCALE